MQILKIRSVAPCPRIIHTKFHQNPMKTEGEETI